MKYAVIPTLLAILGAATAAAQTFSLQFSGPPGEYITLGQSYSYNNQNATLFSAGPTFQPGSMEFDVSSHVSGFHFWTLVLVPYPGTRLDPGVYSNAARWPFQSQQPGLSLYGDGRGCNTLTGSFTVLSSSYSQTGDLLALHATFEQHCEGGPLAATGEINYVSAAAIPALSPVLLLVLALSFALVGGIVLRHA